MTFSYDITTDRGKVRLKIGDTIENVGVRPDGSNFSDAEIDYFLSDGGNVVLAAALACEALANQWAVTPSEVDSDGLKIKRDGVAEKWLLLAQRLRSTAGFSVAHTQVYGAD